MVLLKVEGSRSEYGGGELVFKCFLRVRVYLGQSGHTKRRVQAWENHGTVGVYFCTGVRLKTDSQSAYVVGVQARKLNKHELQR